MEIFTVYERFGNDLGRKLFTGYRGECLAVLEFLITHKGWTLDNLELINSIGRCASFILFKN